MKYCAVTRKDFWRVSLLAKRLTVREYAAKYNYSEQAVRLKCRRGKIPSLKLKGGWLIEDVFVGR